MMPGSTGWMLDVLGHWADRRWLRPLDVALARFIAATASASDASTVLAIALTAHLEGMGHTCLVVANLLDEGGPDLAWPPDGSDALRHVLRTMPRDEAAWHASFAACQAVRIVSDDSADACADDRGNEPFVFDRGRLYLRRYWLHEHRIARAVSARAAVCVDLDERAVRGWIDRFFDRGDMAAAGADPDWQKVACAVALRSPIAIVTGGPGTGKTYTAVRILAALLAIRPHGLRVALAAPTGKAAARLRESIDAAARTSAIGHGDAFRQMGTASTLHALLGTRRGSRRFRHDAAHPLDVDVVLVDEASMIHVEMMDALLAALPITARLILVGDEDQLASVEAGAVLGELCGDRTARYSSETARFIAAATGENIEGGESGGSPLAQRIVRLKRSERFGETLDGLARAVRAGRGDEAVALLPDVDVVTGSAAVAWRRSAVPSDAVAVAVLGYADFSAAIARRPDSLLAEDHDGWVVDVLATFDRFRVLSAVREGPWGVEGLNVAIEERLQRSGWYVGRPIIATRNDPDLEVFNGDVGVVLPTSQTDARLRVWFTHGRGVRSVAVGRLGDVDTAYALTVHRAQGSEFDRVVLVVPPNSPRAVTRELLYTGITRARRSLTVVSADEASLVNGIARTTRRSSGLAAMLRSFR